METKTISVENYINEVLLQDINDVKQEKPYLAFLLIAAGIEFLGKCLSKSKDWHSNGTSQKDFETAICKLKAFQKYRKYTRGLKRKNAKNHKMHLINPPISLYKSLRCGLLHAMLPGENIHLSNGQGVHNEIDGHLTLYLDTFYDDFSAACNELLEKNKIGKNLKEHFFTIGYYNKDGNQYAVTGETIDDISMYRP